MARQSDRRESISLGILDSLKSAGFWSAIGAVGGIVGTVVGVVLFLTADPLRDFAVSVLIIGLVLLFLAIVLSPRAIAIFMAGRQGRYGANLAIMTAAFFIIVILINFLLFRNSTRVDVTATRVFSLSQQTINILGNLDAPVRGQRLLRSRQFGHRVPQAASRRHAQRVHQAERQVYLQVRRP